MSVPSVRFTEREQHVMRALADAKTLEQAAATLFISVNTLCNHVRNINDKVELWRKMREINPPEEP